MGFIVERLTERSSWVGLVAILTGAGVQVAPELQGAIVSVGSGVAGLIGFFTRDK